MPGKQGTLIFATAGGEKLDEIFDPESAKVLFCRPEQKPIIVQPFDMYCLARTYNEKWTDREGLKTRYKEYFDPEVLNAITSKRLRIALLLNSSGGGLYPQKCLMDIINYVQDGEGCIATFGREIVHSAAAECFVEAPRDKRYVEPFTEIMFHLPIFGVNTFEKPGEQDHLERTLLTAVKPEMKSNIQKRLDSAVAFKSVRSDCAIYLTAQEAAELGLSRITSNLREEFNREVQMAIPDYKGTAIEEFFET